jgi:DNA (cytosine-5)-methyltransferase 1
MASDYKGPGHNRDHNFVPVATAFSVREDAKADTFSATPLEVSTALKAQQASPQSHHAQTFVVDQPPVSFQTKQQGLDTAEDIAGTLCANDYKEPQAVAYNLAGSSKRDFSVNETEVSHCLGTGIPAFHEQCQNSVTQIVQSVSFEPGIAAREGGHIYEEISGTLRSNAGDNQMAVAVDAYNQTINQETSQTLGSSATDINHTGGVINPAVKMAVRRLTPTECERLQGFPDGYTAIPWRKKPASECPDGPRYKVLGNSMAVPVMRWIGERIALFESLDLPK